MNVTFSLMSLSKELKRTNLSVDQKIEALLDIDKSAKTCDVANLQLLLSIDICELFSVCCNVYNDYTSSVVMVYRNAIIK